MECVQDRSATDAFHATKHQNVLEIDQSLSPCHTARSSQSLVLAETHTEANTKDSVKEPSVKVTVDRSQTAQVQESVEMTAPSSNVFLTTDSESVNVTTASELQTSCTSKEKVNISDLVPPLSLDTANPTSKSPIDCESELGGAGTKTKLTAQGSPKRISRKRRQGQNRLKQRHGEPSTVCFIVTVTTCSVAPSPLCTPLC